LTEEKQRREQFAEIIYAKRKRKGTTLFEAKKLVRERNYFAACMLESGQADGAISGLTRKYPDTIRPAIEIIGKRADSDIIAGMYLMITKKGPLFLADTTINYNPTSEELVSITLMVDRAVRNLNMNPKIAMLSYSNFGSSRGEEAKKVAEAVEILHEKHPEVTVDGELQANFALNKGMLEELFPFSHLAGKKVNTLIFPNLASGNIAYKMLQEFTEGEVIGPILLGMNKPFHVLQIGSSVREIVNMVTLTAADAQM
jgi:malate dehydrogenase (oxaloacetate-decarboxylating)(NADP+)